MREFKATLLKTSALNVMLIFAWTSVWAGEGIVEINEARALAGGVTPADDAGYPVTISEPGSYALTGNLTPDSSNEAIVITADDVDLNLRGFKIHSAVFADNNQVARTKLHNGSIQNANVIPGSAAVVENLKVTNSSIRVGTDSLVRNNSILNATNWAIRALNDSIVRDNRIDGASSECILARANVQILNNTIKNCREGGIRTSSSALIVGNIITNGGSRFGIKATIGSLLEGNVVSDTEGYGYDLLGGNAALKGNVFENTNGGNSNRQGRGGIEIGGNLCGGASCP